MIDSGVAYAGHPDQHFHAAEVVKLSLLSSYTGGAGSLFSIWFFCLLQISPFFLAFLLGVASMDSIKVAEGGWGKGKGIGIGIGRVFMAGVLSLIGFSVIFTLLGVSAAPSAIILYRYLPLLNQLGGVLILLIGLFYLGLFKIPGNPENRSLWYILSGIGTIFFGMALAFAYRPCVTPTLSEIFNYTKDPRTVNEGALFLISYSAGVTTSLLSVGILSSTLVLISKSPGLKKSVRLISGALLMIMGVMILTDWMVSYKSLLVGRLVK